MVWHMQVKYKESRFKATSTTQALVRTWKTWAHGSALVPLCSSGFCFSTEKSKGNWDDEGRGMSSMWTLSLFIIRSSIIHPSLISTQLWSFKESQVKSKAMWCMASHGAVKNKWELFYFDCTLHSFLFLIYFLLVFFLLFVMNFLLLSPTTAGDMMWVTISISIHSSNWPFSQK